MPEGKSYEFWIDSLAKKIVDRERELDRGIDVIRTESGIGASGIPHVGSMSDSVRAYGVSLGIQQLGAKNEYISFSDSFDGLRKVPSGMPMWLEKHIGEPVSSIPDPFGDCHASYGDHMSGLLIDATKTAGIKFRFISGAEFYKSGALNDQMEKIFADPKKVGQIIKDATGQEKYLDQLPYFPVCENCRKLYTTRAINVQGRKVYYKCDQEFVGENKITGAKIRINGCGHEGWVDYTRGEGKLAWKVEFGARWDALKICFEAYGKELESTIAVSDAVCREVLGFEPPVHIKYELFLEKGGRKISKSFGNVFTPQVWMSYGTPQSLVLLMLKRFQGTRELDVTDIPKYMDEVNHLARIYYGMESADDREKSNLTRLFEYINFLEPPKGADPMIPYSVMTEIAKILPESGQEEFAVERLKEFGYLGKEVTSYQKKFVLRRLELAKSWVADFERQEFLKPEVRGENKKAIEDLVLAVELAEDGEKLQSEIFEIAKRNGVKPMALFKAVYRILLGADRGPRLGSYMLERGKEEVVKKLRAAL